MKRILFTSLFALLLSAASAGAQLKWQTSFDAARKFQTKSGRPIAVDFMASWCGPCRKMDEETFSDPRIRALLAKLELVRLDVDKRPPQAKTYSVNAIPRLIVVSPDGKTLLDIQGFCDADELSQQLRPVLANLGIASPDVPAAQTAHEKYPPEAMRVSEALMAHSYPALKAKDPAGAALGLKQLVDELGAAKETSFTEALKFLGGAGDDAIPAYVSGLSHTRLAVRAGCYRALQETLKGSNLPPYDAWAPAATRSAQAARWSQWLAQRSRRGVAGR